MSFLKAVVSRWIGSSAVAAELRQQSAATEAALAATLIV